MGYRANPTIPLYADVTGGVEKYTACTSRDGGRTWTRDGAWAHEIGDGARLGLVSMGGHGSTATFDEVRVSWR